MKKLFPGYYTPSKEGFQQLWDECIFVFDSSMLLNIYRYSATTQSVFLKVLEGFKDRIWLPHQAAFEFSKNRHEVIEDQSKARAFDLIVIPQCRAYFAQADGSGES